MKPARLAAAPTRRTAWAGLWFLFLGALLAASGTGCIGPAHAPKVERPNIVLLLADDLGWSDLGCYGSDSYHTPHLDRLAAEGVRFTQAYAAAPNCAPTRASLLTGRYVPHHGVYTVNSGARGRAELRRLKPPKNRTELDPAFPTLAELLREAGYATGFVGKWHLGKAPHTGPLQQGFEVNVGGSSHGHPRSYFSPYRNSELADGPPGEYLTDRLAAEALGFIEDNRERPFFLFLSFYAVHTPLQARPEWIERARDRGLRPGQDNAKYAAMIERLDAGVGSVLRRLEELGLDDDTIVVFASDNGGLGGYEGLRVRNVTSNAPLRGGKGMLYEGGVRVPTLLRAPGWGRRGLVCDTPIHTVDLLPTLSRAAGIPAERLAELDLDGVDLRSLLDAGDRDRDRTLFWHFPGYLEANAKQGTWRTTPAGSVRRGRYKLIQFFEDERTELYDLAADPGEKEDLAGVRSELARALATELTAWRARTGAPMPTRP